jgi:hypothetical protein
MAERDPLLGALIDKLPPSGAAWPVDKRAAWLELVWKTFDLVYEGAPEPAELPAFIASRAAAPAIAPAPVASVAPAPPLPPGAKVHAAPPQFYIAPDGRALRDPGGVPVAATEVPNGETIWDKRSGNKALDTIIWRDGTWPADALPALTIANAA